MISNHNSFIFCSNNKCDIKQVVCIKTTSITAKNIREARRKNIDIHLWEIKSKLSPIENDNIDFIVKNIIKSRSLD